MEPEPAHFSVDRLLGGRVELVQPIRGYRVAIDPVLLAAAVPAGLDGPILDAGCGTGAAGLCLLARIAAARVVGLDCDAASLALAARSIARNGAADRMVPILGDLLHPPAELRQRSFDRVMTNPPFGDPLRGQSSGRAERDLAHVERVELGAWLQACMRRLAAQGSLLLIHRAERLGEILAALTPRAGDIRILPVQPHADAPAKRILVRARKGSRTPMRILPPLILHRSDGGYTEQADAILRDAAAIVL